MVYIFSLFKPLKFLTCSREHINPFQPPSFPSTQPCPPGAAPKGCGCVSANNHTYKNTGLPGISAAKRHIFGGRQITGKPFIQGVFQALTWFLHLLSILRTPRVPYTKTYNIYNHSKLPPSLSFPNKIIYNILNRNYPNKIISFYHRQSNNIIAP